MSQTTTLNMYTPEGKETTALSVSSAVFATEVKPSVIHQVHNAILANARQPWADTKNKGEVRGGGKKPWKQKGTGRARHGSIRSPIWRGGGVTFGPLSIRNFTQKINKKMARTALRMVLSGKREAGQLLALESLPHEAKTKHFSSLREQMPGNGKSALLVVTEADSDVLRATRNIQRMDVQRASDLNVADVMKHQYVIITKDAVAALTDRLV